MTDHRLATQPDFAGTRSDTEGKAAAIVVYILYLAGVFSAHLISPIGVIVAYVTRGGASPWVRTHLDAQIKMFWTVVWWMIGLALLGLVLLPLLGLGLVVWWALIPVGVVLTIWFGVKSVLGLLRLSGDKPA
jgi:uncharacterized membrane protein